MSFFQPVKLASSPQYFFHNRVYYINNLAPVFLFHDSFPHIMSVRGSPVWAISYYSHLKGQKVEISHQRHWSQKKVVWIWCILHLQEIIGTSCKDNNDDSEKVSKKMNFHSLKLNCVYLDPLNMSNAGDFSWSWILKDFIQVQKEEEKFVVVCSRPP